MNGDIEPIEAEYVSESKNTIIPAFEHVKLRIVFSWFAIYQEYERYTYISSMGKSFNFYKLSSMIISMYKTLLKPMMKKVKGEKYKPLIEKMEGFVRHSFTIPEVEIDSVVDELAEFLNHIGLTNLIYEVKPWEDRFKDSYGVFNT
jgi:hypothetical protein